MSAFACPECGNDPGFAVAVCPQCRHNFAGVNAAPAKPAGPERSGTDRWERTVFDKDYTPIDRPAPRAGAGNDFYKTLADAGGRARFGEAGTSSDATVIDRGDGAAAPADETVIIHGGHRGIQGPLVYLVERKGIRAGRVHLVDGDTSIGRSPDNRVALGDESVSKHHAKIRREDGRFLLWDLASTNHSYLVNGDGTRTRILEPLPLSDGMTVDLGEARLTYIEVDLTDE